MQPNFPSYWIRGIPEHFTYVECQVGTLLDGDMEGEVVTIEPLMLSQRKRRFFCQQIVLYLLGIQINLDDSMGWFRKEGGKIASIVRCARAPGLSL